MSERMLPEVTLSLALDGAEVSATVARVRVTEELSTPYEAIIELAWDPDALPAPAELLGRRAALSLARGAHVRWFHGVVVAAEFRGATATRHRVDLVVAPALAQLAWRRGYRVYQSVDALSVVRAVLADSGIYDDLDASCVGAAPPAREYCVQYDETDLAFVTRLLAEEGLHFAFTQGDSLERMVVFDGDQSARLAAVQTWEGAGLGVLGHGAATADRESLGRFAWRHADGSEGWRGLDYDFTRPHARVEGRAGASARSVTEYPARIAPAGWDEGSHTYRPPANPGRFASRRQEAARTGDAVLTGEGNVVGLMPGRVVEIADVDASSKRVLVTRVVHLASAPEANLGDGGVAEDRYLHHFEAAPVDAVQRPRRRERPRAVAPHVAVVVGEAGSSEEIVTDHYGRVRVRFFWDDPDARSGAQRGTSASCWLRVAQPWAGPGWGFHFTPRVGMEVIVHFLDGDPDRPFVGACLPNAVNLPPVELPQQRTQSAIRTHSSPTSGGYNELRFEDLDGSEEVYLRAQRDQRVEVLNDRALSVGRDAQARVDRDESLAVGRDRVVDVARNETHGVGGDRQVSVEGDATHEVNGAMAVFVHKALTLSVDETARATVNDGASVFVGGSDGTAVEFEPEKVSVKTPKRHLIAVGDDVTQELTTERFTAKAPKGLALVCGDTRVEIGEDKIVLQTKGGAKVVLDGDKIEIKAGGDVKIKGANVTNN